MVAERFDVGDALRLRGGALVLDERAAPPHKLAAFTKRSRTGDCFVNEDSRGGLKPSEDFERLGRHRGAAESRVAA
jgi:hypothetical protein